MRGALDRVMQAIAGLRTELVQKQNARVFLRVLPVLGSA